MVCQHRGAETLLRQVVTAGRRALPLRTLKIGGGAQRGKVLGASLQAQGTGKEISMQLTGGCRKSSSIQCEELRFGGSFLFSREICT